MAMVRSPSLDASSGPVTGSPSVKLLGFWSSIATATLATAWFGLFVFQLLALPQGWFGIEEYADRFTRLELANLWPSLFLGWTYLLMLAALHYLVAEENRAWTLAALSLGIVYAAMETINYTIQIVAVAPNLEAGQLEGLHLWAGANLDSIFWALALCYGVMALSMLVAAPALPRGGPHRWVRRFFIVAGLSAPLQFGFGLLGWPEWVGVPGTLLWVVGVPMGSILLARMFRSLSDSGSLPFRTSPKSDAAASAEV